MATPEKGETVRRRDGSRNKKNKKHDRLRLSTFIMKKEKSNTKQHAATAKSKQFQGDYG